MVYTTELHGVSGGMGEFQTAGEGGAPPRGNYILRSCSGPDRDKGRRRSTSCTASTGRFSRQSGWSNSVWTVLSSVHRSRPRRRRRISALGEDQLTALLQSLPRLEELTVRVPSFGTGRWLQLLPTSLRTLYVTGPEVTKPRWPGRYGSGLSVSLQGVAADTISHLATELGSRITLLVTDAQITTIPSQLRGAIIRVEPNTVILPAGVGDSELTELRSSRETVKRLSVSAADLPRLRGQLPEGLKRLNIRGPDVTEPRWPEWKPWFHGL
ncbi:uncharacterized protein LOC122369758 [Amphibalanus amphitrite]|uniref:uncharacterized protein LOC122369758 n=1 Tax=Amphibalanus amphitrite TaxID=1232801 RepID=UPI001C8FD800|nr:uncharacterized protein LOC122369758 [Amphibalanus amphitrite]